MPKTIQMSLTIDQAFLDRTRAEHSLAEDMSDEEIVEVMEGLAEEVNSPDKFQILLDNLDIFNF